MHLYLRKENYHPTPFIVSVQIFLFIIIVIGIVLLITQKLWVPKLVAYILKDDPNTIIATTENTGQSSDTYKNATYTIEGTAVTLSSGVSEVETVSGSASKTTTRYFGNEVIGDINSDGTEDVAFLLTQESSGSGTFFYVVAALRTNEGHVGTNAIFLGDRIAPQATEFRDGTIVINYVVREPSEPMSAQPSIGTSTHVTLIDGQLVTVTQ